MKNLNFFLFILFVFSANILLCQQSNSLNFDGTDDLVVIDDVMLGTLGTGDFTIEAWIKSDNSGASVQQIVSNRYYGTASNFFAIRAETFVSVEIYGGASADYNMYGTGSIPVNDGQWHHIAVVRTGTNSDIYVDGVYDFSVTSNLVCDVSSGFNTCIGGRTSDGGGYTNFFDGSIDEVRIWTKARTPEQLRQYMHNPLSGTEDNLKAYYNFNQGVNCGENSSEEILYDLTQNGYNGTLINFTLTEFDCTSNWITGHKNAMQLVFETLADNELITLPLSGTVDVTVDYGDGVTDAFNVQGDYEHTFTAAGTYTVTITGTLTQYGKTDQLYTNPEKLTRVISFGELGLTSLSGAFRQATNLTDVPKYLPETITDLSFTFWEASNFNDPDVKYWDVSNVIDMHYLFAEATSFNSYIGNWNTSNVANMEYLFNGASAFNQDISTWNTMNVTNMYRMFQNAISFNQDISNWNISNLTELNSVFSGATSFNQDLSNWDISNITTMEWLFSGTALSSRNYSNMLNAWSTQAVMSNVQLDADAQYYNTSAAARNILTQSPNNWTITDGGMITDPLTDGLVAHFPFDEINQANDTVNLIAALQNSAMLQDNRFGEMNSSYYFDGSTTEITFPDEDFFSFDQTQAFAFSFFVKFADEFQDMGIMGKGSTGDYEYAINRNAMTVWNTLGNSVIHAGGTPEYSSNNWYHIVYTCEEHSWKIYINGKEVNSGTDGWTTPIDNSNSEFYFGKTIDAFETKRFTGFLDDIRIYDRAITPEEVNDICHEGGWDPLQEGLVAYYPFNGNATDESDYNNNGTTYNNPSLTTNRFNETDNAYRFDYDKNDRIDVAHSSSFATESITFSAWFKSEDLSSWGTIISKDATGLGDGHFTIKVGNGILNCYMQDGSGQYNFTGIPFDDNWNLITFTSSLNEHKIYLNGVHKQTLTNIWSIAGNTLPIYIGGSSSGSLTSFTGKIDDVRIYNKALTDNEVLQLCDYTPVVKTVDIVDITENSSNVQIDVLYKGGQDIMEAGICFSTNPNPTIANNYDSYPISMGTYSIDLNNLEPNTTYYVRAFAENSYGVGYGNEIVFTTKMVPPGNALAINGTSEVIDLGDIYQLNSTQYFTFETWLKTDNPTHYARIFSKEQDGNYRLGMEIWNENETDKFGLGVFVSNGNQGYIHSEFENLESGKWYHIVLVYNGTLSGSLNRAKVYVNGELHSMSLLQDNIVSSTAEITAPVTLCNTSSQSNNLNGAIDEVKIWNKALTQAEIKTNMLTPLSGNEADLIAYYNFDQGDPEGDNFDITDLYDLSGAYSGTLNGFNMSGSTSNFVESYAMVVPENINIIDITSTTFTAKWDTPTNGVVDSYILEIDNDSDFTSIDKTYSVTTVTEQQVVGLYPNTDYFVRVIPLNNSLGLGCSSSTYSATTSPLSPPGNCLDFDGVDSYVQMQEFNLGKNDFTISGWINPSNNGYIISNRYDETTETGNWFAVFVHPSYQKLSFECGTADATTHIHFTSNSQIPFNQWTHFSIIREGTNIKFYINGQFDKVVTDEIARDLTNPDNVISFGKWSLYGNEYKGKMDEIQIWDRALADEEILTYYKSPLNGDELNLVAYYNFDQGIAEGDNFDITELFDLTGTYTGTIDGFTLSGNESNFIESYAMVVPENLTSTSITQSSFVATWTPPAFGEVYSYILEIDNDIDFSSIEQTYTITAGTTQEITELIPNSTYFSRVRAFNNILGIGAPSLTDTIVLATSSNAGTDQFICADTTSLAAQPVEPFTGFWNTTEVGFGVFENSTQFNTHVSDIEIGENKFEWVVDLGGTFSRDTVSVYNNSAYSYAGEDTVIYWTESPIPPANAQLNAENPTPNTGFWTTSVAGIWFDDTTSPTTTANNIPEGKNTFTWTVDNGLCQNSDSVHVYSVNNIHSNADGAWNNPDSWFPPVIPTQYDSVTISGDSITIIGYDAYCRTLRIGTGGVLKIGHLDLTEGHLYANEIIVAQEPQVKNRALAKMNISDGGNVVIEQEIEKSTLKEGVVIGSGGNVVIEQEIEKDLTTATLTSPYLYVGNTEPNTEVYEATLFIGNKGNVVIEQEIEKGVTNENVHIGSGGNVVIEQEIEKNQAALTVRNGGNVVIEQEIEKSSEKDMTAQMTIRGGNVVIEQEIEKGGTKGTMEVRRGGNVVIEQEIEKSTPVISELDVPKLKIKGGTVIVGSLPPVKIGSATLRSGNVVIEQEIEKRNSNLPNLTLGTSGSFSFYTINDDSVRAYIEMAENTTFTIENGGTITIADPNFPLLFVEDGASVVDLGTSGTINGLSLVEKTYQQNQPKLFSTPIEILNTNQFDFGQFYSWDEENWEPLTFDQNLTVMQGYQFLPNQDSIHEFTGTLNSSTQNIILQNNTSLEPNFRGWNLVGNPYMATLNLDTIELTDVENTFYIYNPITETFGIYQQGGISLNGADQYVSIAEGFFVKSKLDAVDPSFELIPEYTNHNFLNPAKEFRTLENGIKLKVQGNSQNDETVVKLDYNFSDYFDSDIDAFKPIAINPLVVQLYTTDDEDNNLAINAFKEPLYQKVIDLYFEAGSTGTYTITVEEYNMQDIYIVDLYDKVTSESIWLQESSTYEFNHVLGADDNRFELIFTPFVNTKEFSENETIQIFSNKNIVYIDLKNDASGTVEIYNKLGQKIETENISGKGIHQIVVNNIYDNLIVKVKTNEECKTQKVFIGN